MGKKATSTNGVCKLCNEHKELLCSHITPKFIGKWLKDSSKTSGFRHGSNLRRPRQDLFKANLLCSECEGKFSVAERRFAMDVFYPHVRDGRTKLSYDSNLFYFCSSLTWRTIIDLQASDSAKDELEPINEHIVSAEKLLREFLLTKRNLNGNVLLHLFVLTPITNQSSDLPKDINRYFLRHIVNDIVIVNDGSIYVYTKLPSFLILGVVKSAKPVAATPSLISNKSGTISPCTYELPFGIGEYIFQSAEKIWEAYTMTQEGSGN